MGADLQASFDVSVANFAAEKSALRGLTTIVILRKWLSNLKQFFE